MGNVKYSLDDCAVAQRRVRRKMDGLLPNSMVPYEEAVAMLEASQEKAHRDAGVLFGHPAGYFVDWNNQLRRIPNSIPTEHNGRAKEVIAKPLSVVTVNAVEDNDPEPEPVALPSPLAEETDDITQEARKISPALGDSEVEDEDNDGERAADDSTEGDEAAERGEDDD